MIVSVNAWSLPRDASPERQLEAAAAAGFGGVEWTIGSDGPLTFDSPLDEWRRLADRVRAAGLCVTGLASGSFFQAHYASPSPAVRRLAIERTVRMLDVATALETDAIVVIPAVVGRAADPVMQVPYAQALRDTYSALVELRHEAAGRGVHVAIENAWNRFLLSPVEMADLVDRVNSPWVGCCLDVGNVMAIGYPQDWIDTLGRRIVRVHVKDYDLNRPGRDGFCPIGEGSVDWAAVAAALRHVGYAGPLTLEGPGDHAEMRRRIAAHLGAPEDRSPQPAAGSYPPSSP